MAVMALEIFELGDTETQCMGHQGQWRCRARAALIIVQVKKNRRERLRRCAGHGRELVERFMRG